MKYRHHLIFKVVSATWFTSLCTEIVIKSDMKELTEEIYNKAKKEAKERYYGIYGKERCVAIPISNMVTEI